MSNSEKNESSLFAEALTPYVTYSFQRPVQVKPMTLSRTTAQLHASPRSEGLLPDGLSTNHDSFSDLVGELEEKNKARIAEPRYPSVVLGPNYEYGFKQLGRKSPRHWKDFEDPNFSIEEKTSAEMAFGYRDAIERTKGLCQKKNGPDFVHKPNGTLNKQEKAEIFGDPKTRRIVAFEKNALYENFRFISGYSISQDAFDDFVITGNVGMNPAERIAEKNKTQQEIQQQARELSNSRLFSSSLPEDARIENKQLREAELIRQKMDMGQDFLLSEKEQSLLERAEKYKQYKSEFEKKNKQENDEL